MGHDGGSLRTMLASRPWLRGVGASIAIVLLAAAIWTVRDELQPAFRAVADAPIGNMAILLGTIVLSLGLTGGVFSALMSRYGRVGLVEMQTLMASAAMLNYLPLRPGLFGRLAYHRIVNGIPVIDSSKTVLQALSLSALLAIYMVAVALLCVAVHWPSWPVAAMPMVLLPLAVVFPGSRAILLAALLRYLDLLATAVRYYTAFALVGAPIDQTTALTLAALAMLAAMVPLLSNGLGLREWVIGLVAPLLGGTVRDVSIAADLVVRAAEIILIVPMGSVALLWISSRRRRCQDPPP